MVEKAIKLCDAVIKKKMILKEEDLKELILPIDERECSDTFVKTIFIFSATADHITVNVGSGMRHKD